MLQGQSTNVLCQLHFRAAHIVCKITPSEPMLHSGCQRLRSHISALTRVCGTSPARFEALSSRKSASPSIRASAATSENERKEVPRQQDDESSILTLPTILTLTRVAAIPALIAVWFGSSSSTSPFITAGIFLSACITDFLDGYLARRMGTHSPFGAFLDPVADKLMVSTVLILLSSRPFVTGAFAGNAWLMPTIASAIIGREIAMSALREWAASLGSEAHEAVAVSPLGKWKTTTQMASLVALLLSSGGSHDSWFLELSATIGPPLLLVAAFLTLFSLYEYLRGLWKYLT